MIKCRYSKKLISIITIIMILSVLLPFNMQEIEAATYTSNSNGTHSSTVECPGTSYKLTGIHSWRWVDQGLRCWSRSIYKIL